MQARLRELFAMSGALLGLGSLIIGIFSYGVIFHWNAGHLTKVGLPLGLFLCAVGLAMALPRRRLGLFLCCLVAAALAAGIGALFAVFYWFLVALAVGYSLWSIEPHKGLQDHLLRFVVGVAGVGAVIQLIAGLPVNYFAVYFLLSLIPIGLQRHRLWLTSQLCLSWLLQRPDVARHQRSKPILSRALLLTLFAVLFIGLCKVVGNEPGFDALATHLHIILKMEHLGYWHFDIEQMYFALMPKLNSWFFAPIVFQESEVAARLGVWALFSVFLLLLASELQRELSDSLCLTLLIAVAASPVVLWINSEIFEEALLTALVTAAFLCLKRFFDDPADRKPFYIACFLFGAMLATKYQALFFGFFGIALIYAAFSKLPTRRAFACLTVGGLWFAVIGPIAYLRALALTGSAIYPFSNSWDLLLTGLSELSIELPYLLTFETSKFIRPLDGTANFAHLMLLPLGLIAAPLLRRDRFSNCLLLVTATYCIAIFAANCYNRYMVYSFPLLALLSVPVLQRAGALRLVSLAGFAVAFALNIAALPGQSVFGTADAWLSPHHPSRANIYLAATETLNRQLPAGARVITIGAPFVAGYRYDQLYFMSEEAAAFFAAKTPELAAKAAKDLGITHIVRITETDRRANAQARALFIESYGKLIAKFGHNALFEFIAP